MSICHGKACFAWGFGLRQLFSQRCGKVRHELPRTNGGVHTLAQVLITGESEIYLLGVSAGHDYYRGFGKKNVVRC